MDNFLADLTDIADYLFTLLYNLVIDLRDQRNLREIINRAPARYKLHTICYPFDVILNIISIEVHQYSKLFLRKL